MLGLVGVAVAAVDVVDDDDTTERSRGQLMMKVKRGRLQVDRSCVQSHVALHYTAVFSAASSPTLVPTYHDIAALYSSVFCEGER